MISEVDSFCMQNELRLKDQVKSLQEKLSAVRLSVHICGVYIVIQPGLYSFALQWRPRTLHFECVYVTLKPYCYLPKLRFHALVLVTVIIQSNN